MNLTKNQIAFILDVIESYEGYGNFTTADKKYSLTKEEVDVTIELYRKEMLKQEASQKINKILTDLSIEVNRPIKEIRLNERCSYFKDNADASYYITIEFEQ